jgi:hypothetical protein
MRKRLVGWLAGQVLRYLSLPAFVLHRLCSTVCIPDDSGMTANIQVYNRSGGASAMGVTVYIFQGGELCAL